MKSISIKSVLESNEWSAVKYGEGVCKITHKDISFVCTERYALRLLSNIYSKEAGYHITAKKKNLYNCIQI